MNKLPINLFGTSAEPGSGTANPVRRRVDLMLLSFFWLAMVLITDPRGEFPLNDDWMYARSVLSLVEKGRYVLCDFQAVTALLQILWGALFAKIFGFSMTILRVSVLVLGWAGVLISYLL